jgi:modification methylase
VPFAAVVEAGLIAPGATVTDPRGRVEAIVRPDGMLALDGVVGSIHKVGAHAMAAEACNGWTFWHIDTPSGRRPIDDMRARIRAELAPMGA